MVIASKRCDCGYLIQVSKNIPLKIVKSAANLQCAMGDVQYSLSIDAEGVTEDKTTF
jgi:hypothetical protein